MLLLVSSSRWLLGTVTASPAYNMNHLRSDLKARWPLSPIELILQPRLLTISHDTLAE